MGVEAFDAEARLMAASASGKTVAGFFRDSNLFLTDDGFEKAMQTMLERRETGEPLAYILGEWEFYGMMFNVTPDVLIPRVDTEVLVRVALDKLGTMDPGRRIIDLCTGSGCVGMAIVSEIRSARAVLVDNSAAALSVCRSNMLKNRLTKNISCLEADLFRKPPVAMGSFDMAVCNPPYIPSGDIAGLDVSVKDFEPIQALDGGGDGLDLFRAAVDNWTDILRRGAWLLFECGIGQFRDVGMIMYEHGFDNMEIYRDTLGIERVVAGQKK